jgi:hypothetical protein
MSNEERYTFTYEYGDVGVTMSVGMGLNVEEMLEQFENFLLATGYRLHEGQSVGLVDDAAETAPESKVDGYIGGLFDDHSGSVLKFDGAAAWAAGADYLHFDGGDARAAATAPKPSYDDVISFG